MQRLKQVLVSFLRSTIFVWINVLRRYRLRRYKYVHLMFNDKFNKPFVDFLNKYFNPDEHLVICERILRHPFPVGKNVMKVWTFKGLDLGYKNIEKIICHSLCEHELVDILYAHKDWLAKSYWMIWGGDLYDAPRNVVDDYVRSHFAGMVTGADGDGEVARIRYGSDAEIYHARYAFPVSASMIEDARRICKKDDKEICIQVNNSCDESTIDLLERLAVYQKMAVRIRVILSYGELAYKNQIIAVGRRNFGEKFEFVDHYMSPSEYAKWFSKNDVFILGQNRQQGIGNSLMALAFGAKLYIRSTVTTFDHLRKRGAHVFDTLSIPCSNYEEFVALSEGDRSFNKELSDGFFSDDKLAELWSPVLGKVVC